jgi:hypothetical protein
VTIKREEANRINWQFQAAAHTKWKPDDIKSVYLEIQKLGNVGFVMESVYETVAYEDRVNMVGSAIHDQGQKWIDSHPGDIEWLKENGLTPQEAEQQFKDWITNARSNFDHVERRYGIGQYRRS